MAGFEDTQADSIRDGADRPRTWVEDVGSSDMLSELRVDSGEHSSLVTCSRPLQSTGDTKGIRENADFKRSRKTPFLNEDGTSGPWDFRTTHLICNRTRASRGRSRHPQTTPERHGIHSLARGVSVPFSRGSCPALPSLVVLLATLLDMQDLYETVSCSSGSAQDTAKGTRRGKRRRRLGSEFRRNSGYRQSSEPYADIQRTGELKVCGSRNRYGSPASTCPAGKL